MKKPGQRGARYKPRGKAYAPERLGAGVRLRQAGQAGRAVAHVLPRNVTFDDARAQAPVAVADQAVVVEVGALDFDTPSGARSAYRWQPRESVVIPVLLTIGALVVMHNNPVPRVTSDARAQPIVESRLPSVGDVTRVALLKSDAVEPLFDQAPIPSAAFDHAPPVLIESAAPEVAVRDVGHLGAVPLVRACTVPDDASDPGPRVPVGPDQFGSALASAAEAQTREFVVYDDEYRVIRYPGGDVATLYGVCTDVIVRAYRALGIDLQRLVHESQVGSGDTNISHRRTEALRRFFKKSGASVAITDFAEDYLPGDVVTYHRPQNYGSNDHIAIVSNVTGPSGRPMIVHNRGFGPQVEDALFVNEMTGHFRYSGPAMRAIGQSVAPSTKAEKRSVRSAERTSRRISNSVLRKMRRAASLRAANGAGGPKSAPKL